MRILTYITTEEDAGHAVRSVVPRRFRLGTHAFRRLKVEGGILCDGMPVRADTRLRAGQVLEIRLDNGEMPGAALTPDDALPPSFIRYADEDILIVSKGAPLATLPCGHIHTGTLREQLAALLGQDAASFDYHPVNRLDKGTSGLMPIALNAVAHARMQRMLHTGQYVREYLAVTEGAPQADAGVIDRPIGHAEGVRRCIDPSGKHAVTHYTVLERAANGRALLRLRLETGRTHQIRVHLQSLGCPIAGDYLYGEPLPQLAGRFALHAARMQLTHPMTGETLTFESPLPEALAALLKE